MAAIPWVDISKYPSDYYDTDCFKIPIKLRAPERLSLAELWSLAEFLSSLEVDASLVFRCKEDIKKRLSLREADEELEKEDCDEDLEDTSDNEGLESILQQSTQDASRDTVATDGGDSAPVGDKGGNVDEGITEGNEHVTSTVDWSKDGDSEAGASSEVSANEDDSSGDEDSNDAGVREIEMRQPRTRSGRKGSGEKVERIALPVEEDDDKASVSETEKHRPRTRSGGKGSGKNAQTKSSRLMVAEDSRMTRSQASRNQRNLRSSGTSSTFEGPRRGVKRRVDHSESNAWVVFIAFWPHVNWLRL